MGSHHNKKDEKEKSSADRQQKKRLRWQKESYRRRNLKGLERKGNPDNGNQ